MIDPNEFEARYEERERRLIAWLVARRFPGAEALVAAALGAWVFVLFPGDWSAAYPTWARMELFQERNSIAAVLVALSVVLLEIPGRARNAAFFLALSAAWVAACFHLRAWSASAFAMPSLALLGWAALKLRRPSRAARMGVALGVMAGFAAVAWGLGMDALHSGDSRILRLFWLLHPELQLAAVLYWLWAGPETREPATMALIPTNALAGLLWPIGLELGPVDARERRALWWRGFAGLAGCHLLMIVLFKYLRMCAGSGIRSELLAAPMQYLAFLLSVVAGFGILTAITRMYGIPAPSITRFLFLARSPLDIWRRGSTYVYDFVFRVVYLPAFRATRSLALTALACLLAVAAHLFFFHELVIRGFYAWTLPGLPGPAVEPARVLAYTFSYCATWFALIVGFSFLRLRRPWLAILLTHASASYVSLISFGFLAPRLASLLAR